ncbi:MAG: 2-oxoacid:acceptor oxidoreductase family protein [Anaerolineaceae bacterium]|nr:2-oxoacid:acceptor oxidoreductase family protein [Anaerolineaceae bacterium]
MLTEIIISGFGGQGVLLAGQLLAYAGMDADFHVTWLPSYGPEMRGGTANCTVIIGDEEIGAPVVQFPQAVVAMNLPSLIKYEDSIKPGGFVIINSSIIEKKVSRDDIHALYVPANQIAETLGNVRMTNMVMVGSLIANTGVLPLDAVKKSLSAHLPSRHSKFLPLNYQALDEGAKYLAE